MQNRRCSATRPLPASCLDVILLLPSMGGLVGWLIGTAVVSHSQKLLKIANIDDRISDQTKNKKSEHLTVMIYEETKTNSSNPYLRTR